MERYFVSQSQFPWTTFNSTTYPTADTAVPYGSVTSEMYGLCGTSCALDGVLITNNELKTEFRSRDFAASGVTLANQIRVGKAIGSSSSIYACFTPLSKSLRDKACTDGKVYTLGAGAGVRTSVSGVANCGSTVAAWSSGVAGTQLVVCLPE